jgi:hypothetical protein
MMPKSLTAENGAKYLLSGEFFVYRSVTCPECIGDGCEDCKGIGGWTEAVPVDWPTIKDIYAKIVQHYWG